MMNDQSPQGQFKKQLDSIREEYQMLRQQLYSRELTPEEISHLKEFEQTLESASLFEQDYADLLSEIETKEEFENSDEMELVDHAVRDVSGFSSEDYSADEEDDPGDLELFDDFFRLVGKVFSFTENRLALQGMCLQVVERVKPGEVNVSAGLIDPLIDNIQQGAPTQYGGRSSRPGAFEGADLLIILVAPLMTVVLGRLLEAYQKKSVVELVQEQKNIESSLIISPDDLEAAISLTNYQGDTSQLKELAKAARNSIIDYIRDFAV